jgi:hypothetical protein
MIILIGGPGFSGDRATMLRKPHENASGICVAIRNPSSRKDCVRDLRRSSAMGFGPSGLYPSYKLL